MNETLLCNFEDALDGTAHHALQSAKWDEAINQDLSQLVTSNGFSSSCLQPYSSEELLQTAIAFLFKFLQQNFCGPNLKNEESSLDIASKLAINGEDIDVNVFNADYLYCSKVLLEYLYENHPGDLLINIWYCRYVITHQRIIEENVNTLYELFVKLAKFISIEIGQLPSIKNQILIKLELVQGYLLYRRVVNTESMLSQLEDEIKVHLNVESALGVRTKYQVKALPQLYLNVKAETQTLGLQSAEVTHGTTRLPVLLNLDDEVRLEKVKFESEEHNKPIQLDSAIQNLILTTVFHIELSQPKDKLANEELAPYLSTLLSQTHGPWMTRILALMMNIKLESSHRRTVERSLKQCEDVVHHIKRDQVDVQQRLSYCFSAGLIPIWKIECQLAALMLNLGLVKAALDIFLRLNQWEDVIVCYTTLQLRHKAAEIIQQEIDKQPTAKLYCLLGDATDDVSCYSKAWELSQHRSSRAQRHWGNYYFSKKEYEQSIEHLEKSLEINSLQEVVWLRLGFAALSLEKWELAARAYRRYTQIEPYGFESWNNLAKSYIKLNDKPRAHKVLQEALKCNFSNWKVWENFLIVSIDTGNFEDALNSYNRLMELKGKYMDKQVLEIMMRAIANDVPDAAGNKSFRLKKKALGLLAHLGCQFLSEGIIWELAANLHVKEPLNRAQKLQQAYKVYTQSHISWTKDPKMCEKILKICKALSEASLEAAASFEVEEKSKVLSQLSSARLTCQGCIRAASVEKWPECDALVSELSRFLDNLTVELQKHM